MVDNYYLKESRVLNFSALYFYFIGPDLKTMLHGLFAAYIFFFSFAFNKIMPRKYLYFTTEKNENYHLDISTMCQKFDEVTRPKNHIFEVLSELLNYFGI